MIPMVGSAIKANAKAGKKVLSAVGNLVPVAKTKKRITSLKLTFRVSEEGTGFFEQIRKALDDIYSKMNRSQCYVEIAGVGRVPIDEVEGILEDGAGNVIVKMGDDAADAISDGRKALKELIGESDAAKKRGMLDDGTNQGVKHFDNLALYLIKTKVIIKVRPEDKTSPNEISCGEVLSYFFERILKKGGKEKVASKKLEGKTQGK